MSSFSMNLCKSAEGLSFTESDEKVEKRAPGESILWENELPESE